ncbi:MAG: hypothetical protein MAG581_01229 [Deltaproteobacteria bacterium]|jgi:hypothetical protein|nr:hypothetical protein [Deltaproteobacteria bacterium]
MPDRRAHRSFVSYIDKSREYYAAHGYTQPYQWPYHHDVPFTSLTKTLSDCTVGVVTTATLPANWQNLPESQTKPVKKPYAEPSVPIPDVLYTMDMEWDKDSTHTDDLDTYLPLHRLQELRQSGRIGKISSRFYGVPTTYSQRQTHQSDAPAILNWCKEDGVDVVLLVPL